MQIQHNRGASEPGKKHYTTVAAAKLQIIALLLFLLGGIFATAGAPSPAAAETPGPKAVDRLAADLTQITNAQLKTAQNVPEQDKPRTAKCLARAIAADVPEADAAKLADIFEGKAKPDKALEIKWLGISQKQAPARNAQVMAAINKLCPDLGPYVKPMMQ